MRSGKSISLIMADIDYFKAYNDNYGHLKGDESLIKVANTMVSSVKRPLDLVSRYGGEEFAVILAEADIKGATIVASPSNSIDDFINSADKALYSAKSNGRNTIFSCAN